MTALRSARKPPRRRGVPRPDRHATQIDDTSWCFRTGAERPHRAAQDDQGRGVRDTIATSPRRWARRRFNHIAQRFRAGSAARSCGPSPSGPASAVTAGFPHEPGQTTCRCASPRRSGAFTGRTRLLRRRSSDSVSSSSSGCIGVPAVLRLRRGPLASTSSWRSSECPWGSRPPARALAEHETAFLLPELPAAIAVV